MAGKLLVIDFETRSTLNLRKVGAWRYAADPETDVLCACGVLGDGDVGTWVPGNPVPIPVIEAVADPNIVFVAHFATFEIAIWKHVLAPRHRWPEHPPAARWRDTQAMALAAALPPRLDKVAKALSLKQQKADDHVMHLTCKPRPRRGNEDPAKGPYWYDDEKRLAELYEYCAQDVRCERELFQWLPPLSPAEQKLWQLDQTINERGFYTDGVLIEKAITLAAVAERAIQAELRQVIGDAQ